MNGPEARARRLVAALNEVGVSAYVRPEAPHVVSYPYGTSEDIVYKAYQVAGGRRSREEVFSLAASRGHDWRAAG